MCSRAHPNRLSVTLQTHDLDYLLTTDLVARILRSIMSTTRAQSAARRAAARSGRVRAVADRDFHQAIRYSCACIATGDMRKQPDPREGLVT
jgi:hypothetical protein